MGIRDSKYLYHYTDEAGANGIRNGGVIWMSTDTNRDAILNEGVYLTDLMPINLGEVILKNNYGAARHGQEGKITWYIKIEKAYLPGVQSKQFADRVIYVYPSHVQLNAVQHTIDKRYILG